MEKGWVACSTFNMACWAMWAELQSSYEEALKDISANTSTSPNGTYYVALVEPWPGQSGFFRSLEVYHAVLVNGVWTKGEAVDPMPRSIQYAGQEA